MNEKFLIVESRYYIDIADLLLQGACNVLDDFSYEFDQIEVNGALEIPIAISMAINQNKYCGFIALGCVIKGETSHFDIVCRESARGLMELGLNNAIPITNGILTVKNHKQALIRASFDKKNYGGHAASSAISLYECFKKR